LDALRLPEWCLEIGRTQTLPLSKDWIELMTSNASYERMLAKLMDFTYAFN